MLKKISRILTSIIFLLVILLIGGYFIYQNKINSSASNQAKNIEFIVDKGESVKQVANNLNKAQLIQSPFFFKLYISLTNKQKVLQAGNYILSPTLPIREIVKILTAGKVKDREITIKILEGWDSAEIADYLAKQGLFKSPDFLKFVGLPKTDYRKRKDLTTPKDFSEQFPFLKDKPIYYGLEGYLFPDTYRIYKDATIEEVVVKMLDNFDKKLTAELRAEIARQKKTIYEIIIMASILEKEVRTPEDMQIVAGIFWKRLENNYPLESCATLAFILGVNKPQYSVEDTKLRSPYNTYLNQGLPPGPISNPGIEAIKAAIYPKDSPYHYFLSRLDTGETVFSQTYSEHLQNKAKYLK